MLYLIINSYDKNGKWLKGNLHAHTENSSCGNYSVEKVIEMYTSYKMKYDFLAITDHYHLTSLTEHINDGIVLFEGVEYKKDKLQFLGVNIKKYEDDKANLINHQELFDEIKKQKGISIICHPHVFNDNYWPFEKLMELDNYIGIEIYNYNVRHDNKGRAVAVDLWDKLLSAGKKVYGFANDDMHAFSRAGGAFNMVLAEKKDKESILKAIKEGSFYASTGIYIEKIELIEKSLFISVKHLSVCFSLIGKDGKVLKVEHGMDVTFNLKGYTDYVRVELKREDGAFAWTQPFFIRGEA
jgi:hypothetical protein